MKWNLASFQFRKIMNISKFNQILDKGNLSRILVKIMICKTKKTVLDSFLIRKFKIKILYKIQTKKIMKHIKDLKILKINLMKNMKDLQITKNKLKICFINFTNIITIIIRRIQHLTISIYLHYLTQFMNITGRYIIEIIVINIRVKNNKTLQLN
jgi:hypothetical protein